MGFLASQNWLKTHEIKVIDGKLSLLRREGPAESLWPNLQKRYHKIQFYKLSLNIPLWEKRVEIKVKREREYFYKSFWRIYGILFTHGGGNLPLSLHQGRGFWKEHGYLVISPHEVEKAEETRTWPLPEKWKSQGLWLTSYSDSQARKDSMVAVCGTKGSSGAVNAQMFFLS